MKKKVWFDKFQVGQRVMIIDINQIEGAPKYFKNGDVVRLTEVNGHLALSHHAEELNGGLVLMKEEAPFIELL